MSNLACAIVGICAILKALHPVAAPAPAPTQYDQVRPSGEEKAQEEDVMGRISQDYDREKRVVVWKKSPHWATVIQSNPYIKGALICETYDDIDYMTNALLAYQSAKALNDQMRGTYTLMHGQITKPDPSDAGCVLLPPGTRVLAKSQDYVPVVTISLVNKTKVVGVMLPIHMVFDGPAP